jgi:hypothetical protein
VTEAELLAATDPRPMLEFVCEVAIDQAHPPRLRFVVRH